MSLARTGRAGRVRPAARVGILSANLSGATPIKATNATNATVVATFSRRMQLRLDDGHTVEARIRGKKLRPVCGDRVEAEPLTNEDDWLIMSIGDRRNRLARPDLRGNPEVLAANVDVIVAVAAPVPAPDWFVIDRYLIAAELMRCDGAVVFNKADSVDTPPVDALAVYEGAGYPVLCTSAATGQHIAELNALLDGRIGVLVGQSGVGKSSLINRLTGSEDLKTASVSRKWQEGRHTTVNSVLIPLAAGGAVIDSPGVRDFAPAIDAPGDVEAGFPEIHAAAGGCRFADCRHLREPGCAVKDAVDSGEISARRYESYRRLLALTEKLANRRQRR